jgi:hypothetical protein
MKSAACCVALISLAVGGCPPAPRTSDPGQTTDPSEDPGKAKHVSRRSPTGDRARAARALAAGIRDYNDGRIAEAREELQSALKETRGVSRAAPGSTGGAARNDLARIRAETHFYLAAVAWDLHERVLITYHLKLCRHVDPSYEPADWTSISPGLRKRFESLK